MEECKVMQAKAKAMKATYESACPGYKPKGKGINKCSAASSEEVNAIVKAVMKASRKKKNKAVNAKDEGADEDLYNFDGLNIDNDNSSG